MTVHHLLEVYNLGVGLIAAAGLMYLLYSQRFLVGYRRFLDFLVMGFLMFSVGGPLAELIAPRWSHAVHGLSALLVVFGLYDPIHNDLRKAEWAELILSDPAAVRTPEEWMTPMDEDILELFRSADLVLTPSIIAYNLDYTRESVNRRLTRLQKNGMVDRVERGKYRMTELGEQYLQIHPVNDTGNRVVESNAS